MATKHLVIRGNVQGVFYRASARNRAEALGVTGWIRNTEGGEVEAVVSGTDEQVYEFIRWCRQGPAGATVTDVAVAEMAESSFASFRIVR